MSCTSNLPASQTVAALVVEKPHLARVFERLGIDYCCGGRQSLAEACSRAGVDQSELANLLASADTDATDEPAEDWSAAPLSQLTRHIVERHHAYLQTELPRLAQLISKVVAAHGENHAELAEVARVFDALQAELSSHMMKEERVLFPIVETMEQSAKSGRSLPAFHCGSVDNPIAVMEDEHQHAGDALARLRSLTGGYVPPADACPTYHALLDSLARLEADLHLHIHKENNILFPRAAALEKQLNG